MDAFFLMFIAALLAWCAYNVVAYWQRGQTGWAFFWVALVIVNLTTLYRTLADL